MTWKQHVIGALQALGGTGSLGDIYEQVQAQRSSLPKSWKAIVRRELESHSSDSRAFGGVEDLFHSVDGIGAGIWALR